MRSPRVKSACAAAALLVASAAPGVGAQEPAPVVLRPVQVVATRSAEAPDEVPASIEVISGEMLRARGATTLRDALALVAGVSIAPGGDGGPASAVPELWGLREFDAFLLVVDNVPWGGALNPAIATASLRDVERIEILHGPAPVTYGATSFVGVVHIVHKAAAESSRYVEAHGGTFGSGGVAIDLGVPLGSWKSRASVDVERQGFEDEHTELSRAHLLWRVSVPGGGWLRVDLNRLRQDPASPHPRAGPILSTAVPLDANHNPSGAYLDEDRVNVAAGWERIVLGGATWGSTASVTHSSQQLFRGFLAELSDVPDNAAGFKEEIDILDVYLDTHLLWGGTARVRFMAGADALVARGEAKGATFTYTAPLDGAIRPSVAEPSSLPLDAEDERTFLSGYGSVEWRPTARLTATAGARLNSTSEKRGEGETSKHTKLSGSVGALLGIWERDVDHVRLFANYRHTFKPAAFDFGLAENEGVLDPETSRSYEGGVKVRTLKGRLDMEASYFDMRFENLVTSVVVNDLPALINAGTTRFKGVELSTDVQLPRSLFARATYSFHDGRFVDFVQSFDGAPTQLGGNRFEMSPRHLASLGLTLAPERGVVGSVTWSYTGDRQLNKRNTALAPSFSTYDAGIGYRLRRAEIRIDGRNLTDARDPVSESEFGDAQYYRMAARSFTIRGALSY